MVWQVRLENMTAYCIKRQHCLNGLPLYIIFQRLYEHCILILIYEVKKQNKCTLIEKYLSFLFKFLSTNPPPIREMMYKSNGSDLR